jgi:hypothetical protein
MYQRPQLGRADPAAMRLSLSRPPCVADFVTGI